MNFALYWLGRMLVAFVQALPLAWVIRLGRAGGALAITLDARHREVALRNLAMCFPEKAPEEIASLARENFRRIGENFGSAVKTAAMSEGQIRALLTVSGCERFVPFREDGPTPRSVVVAIGHFGNFELYARTPLFAPGFRPSTTYRGLRQPGLDRLLQKLRSRSGCAFFERRRDAAALKAAIEKPGLMIGLLADQHAGDRGARMPFLGHDCSTSVAPAVLALRYGCPLFTGICFRTAPGRWHIEYGDEIPTHEHGRPRDTEAITADVNRAFETAIRRDPANWFWVHNRWKPGKWRRETVPDEPATLAEDQ